MLELFEHQKQALEQTKENNKCAYYLDMGLGKTFVGSEKIFELNNNVNLVVCQKSKIDDWVTHFLLHYDACVYNLTNKKEFEQFIDDYNFSQKWQVAIINYELAFRRPELLKLEQFTLMLDESSLIQNENAKRSKFIMKLKFENLILLSGTPTGGKYEKLYSQLYLLGYKLTKKAYWNMYVNYRVDDAEGFPVTIVEGYKNVERLKRKMRQYGCVFMKSDEVFNLPQQNFIDIKVNTTKECRKFRKDCIVEVENGVELVGDTTLTKMLYERQLCGQYNKAKFEAFKGLIESTDDRLIVFYNFNEELKKLKEIAQEYNKACSVVNGNIKDLSAYEEVNDSITFIQYQAGAMGLNLQKANKIIYFSPPLSSELYEQSKKRIHRIGQQQSCFYYKLICKSSIEEKIYRTLEMRKDYTDKLFEKER